MASNKHKVYPGMIPRAEWAHSGRKYQGARTEYHGRRQRNRLWIPPRISYKHQILRTWRHGRRRAHRRDRQQRSRATADRQQRSRAAAHDNIAPRHHSRNGLMHRAKGHAVNMPPLRTVQTFQAARRATTARSRSPLKRMRTTPSPSCMRRRMISAK